MNIKKITSALLASVLGAALLVGCSMQSAPAGKNYVSEEAVSGAASSAAGTTAATTSAATTASTDANTASSAATAAESGASASTGTSQTAAPQPSEAAPTDVTVVDPSDLNEPESPTEATADNPVDETITARDGSIMQVVFLGDSQLDNFRDATGIAYLVSQYCNANVYNLAMGGTAASLLPGEPHGIENWNSRCFLGMVYAITGKVDPSFFSQYHAYDVFQSCDFSKTDVFVIEYGVNDYFNGAAVNNPNNVLDLETYGGALNVGLSNLMNAYPNALYVVCGPSYAQFFKGDKYLGDGNILSNGKATLQEYAQTADQVAAEFKAAYLDAYWSLGINSYNADEYLLDGVHLSEEGRRSYAQAVSRIILRSMGYDIAPGTNLDTLDWSTVHRTDGQ